MKKQMNLKRGCGLLVLLALLLSLAAPALAAEARKEQGAEVLIQPISGDAVSISAQEALQPEILEQPEALAMDPIPLAQIVRVSIVLEGESTIGRGFSTERIAENREAMSYRQQLLEQQNTVTRSIEARLGEPLDVCWNLTLAANMISANVAYGQIAAIESVPGVAEVVPEARYYPAVEPYAGEGTLDPMMSISTGMTGMKQVFSAGYTGAGSRVAIVDTGLDTDHQSFAEESYLYALERNAAAAGKTLEEYEASLDMLDAEEMELRLPYLNAKKIYSGVTAAEVYRTEKVPFAFNYVDKGLNVTHDNDKQGDHGSHVAGITTANRFIKKADGTMADAVSTVAVVGNAPDAQLLVMKVFGSLGGAFDSDIVAAVEDAIILGADAVNLSLGSTSNGFSTSAAYANVMETLIGSDTIMCVAAGNDGAWPEYSNTRGYLGSGYLYAEDVMMDRVSNPASLTDSLTVASVDNKGQISSASITVTAENGETFTTTYTENIYNNMKAMTTLDTSSGGTGTTYDFVFTEGYGEVGDFDFIDLTGKIAIISRGNGIAFYEKAHYAVDCGAIATIMYNNEEGSFGMDMSSYNYEQPSVSITQEEGARIKALAKRELDDDNNVYYTGRITVKNGLTVIPAQDQAYTMSSFSSWGVPGDLTMKPEITAPGGNIYSVRGDTADTDKYKTMSGTSMATPQVTGIVGTVREYLGRSGLAERVGLSERQITQSLLMSTAVPMKDKQGRYFPVIQQGAGLAYGAGVIGANAVILMDADATASWEDGKVKAEVGDDPERTGVYSFSFTIYNTTGEAEVFDLSADAFTQDYTNKPATRGSSIKVDYMTKTTHALESSLAVAVNGAAQTGKAVTVPANGSVKVTVTLTLAESGKSWMNEHFPNGSYLQAFVYAAPRPNGEGVTSATHSIPVLGFYGNWTDPSMFDGASYANGEILTNYCTSSTTDHSRVTYAEDYSQVAAGNRWVSMYGKNHATLKTVYSGGYAYGGNPLVRDERYMPERDALSSGATLVSWDFCAARDYSMYTYRVEDLTSHEVFLENWNYGDEQATYYAKSASAWQIQNARTVRVNYKLPELPEDHTVKLSLTVLPEYYDEGRLGAASVPGNGATLAITAAVDNTAPHVRSVAYNEDGTLDVTAYDSNYVAAVVLYNEDGTKLVSYTGADQEVGRGEDAVYTLRTREYNRYMLQVFDYAMNAATYSIEIRGGDIVYSGNKLAFDLNTNTWVRLDKNSSRLPAVTESGRIYTAATAADETIYAVAYGTELYRLSVSDPSEPELIGEVGFTPVDLAWNAADGKLYAVTDESKLIVIDPVTGSGTVLGSTPVQTNTLGCDAEGRFYSNRYGTGQIYSYTLDSVKKANTGFDFSGDGVLNEADCQALLDYVNGARSSIQHKSAADLDADGDVDSHDAFLLFDKLPAHAALVCNMGIASKYMQSMALDPNDGTLYWASYSADQFGTQEVTFSVLYEIDVEHGTYRRFFDVSDQLSCLILLDREAGRVYEPVNPMPGINDGGAHLYTPSTESGGIVPSEGDETVKAALVAAKEAGTDGVRLMLSSDLISRNGRYTVSYDPSVLQLTAVETGAGLSSVKEGEGSLSFAFAGSARVPAGESVATLRFEPTGCAGSASITCLELNNEHPDTTAEQNLGAHEWGEWTVDQAPTCSETGQWSHICSLCGYAESETLPKDPDAHVWSNWETAQSATDTEPGKRTRTCTACGLVRDDWVLPTGMTTTEKDVRFSTVPVNEFYITSAVITKTAVTGAWRMETEDSTIRCMVELSSATDETEPIHVHINHYAGTASGIGYAIKREKVGSVGATNGSSDDDYDVTLTNGLGHMRCYSYEKSDYRQFDLYFYVGDQDGGSGSVTYINTIVQDQGMTDTYLKKIGVWNANILKYLWAEPVIDTGAKTEHHALNIWLDPEADNSSDILLELTADGAVYVEGGNGANVAGSILALSMAEGSAEITLRTPPRASIFNHRTRYYTITISTRTNIPPALLGTATEASRTLTLGETMNLDLGTIFRDPDGDELSYTVSVDGAEPIAAQAAYQYTPTKVGTTLLRFMASDGECSSPAYTVVLLVQRDGVLLGDVNGDGKVNAKDVTQLARWLASWQNVTIDEAAADVNGDGKVNSKDLTWLKRSLASWEGYSLS